MTVNKIISVFKLRIIRIWMRIFILYLKIFFAYSLIFLILLWFKICWGDFEISVTDMLQFFLLNTSKWMILVSDKFLTRKVKKTKEITLWFFWNFIGKFTQIFFIENFVRTGRNFLFLIFEYIIDLHDSWKYLSKHSRCGKILIAFRKLWGSLFSQKFYYLT